MSRPQATDVHQHLWPEGFVRALSRRRSAPCVKRVGRDWSLRLPVEPDYRFSLAIHDPAQRRRSLRGGGLDRALLAMSSPLGVEALPEDESRELLDAWHEGVFGLEDFGIWGGLPLHGATAADVDALLARGAVGISLPASALDSPDGLERLDDVLRRLELRDVPLFVHPGPDRVVRGTGAPAAWWPALTTYVAEMQAAWLAFAGWGRHRHPALRVCFAMLAGGAPFQVERLAARGGPAKAVADKRLFYDTSSYGSKAIATAASIIGADQLVHGSDRPIVDGSPSTALGRQAGVAMTRENVARMLNGARP
jgi:hypothetical protein